MMSDLPKAWKSAIYPSSFLSFPCLLIPDTLDLYHVWALTINNSLCNQKHYDIFMITISQLYQISWMYFNCQQQMAWLPMQIAWMTSQNEIQKHDIMDVYNFSQKLISDNCWTKLSACQKSFRWLLMITSSDDNSINVISNGNSIQHKNGRQLCLESTGGRTLVKTQKENSKRSILVIIIEAGIWLVFFIHLFVWLCSVIITHGQIATALWWHLSFCNLSIVIPLVPLPQKSITAFFAVRSYADFLPAIHF